MPAAALALSAGLAQAQTVTLDNPLDACVAPQLGVRQTSEGMLLQPWRLDARKPVAECGCKSALLRYEARAVTDDGDEVVLQSGLVNSRNAGVAALTLASDAQLARGLATRGLVLSLGCAPPR